MRCPVIVKAILLLTLAALAPPATGAEYRDGKLWLDILLNSGTELTVTAPPGKAPGFLLSETDSPIQKRIPESFSIRLANPEKLAYWGVLRYSEPWREDSGGVMREQFAWRDSQLVIDRLNLVYDEFDYPDRESACLRAAELGLGRNQVESIPMLNSTVVVRTASGEKHYFETPLSLHSFGPLRIDGSKLDFEGEFRVKTSNGQVLISQVIDLEEYLAGVIQNEIGSNAPAEALKAQAVAARTHAVNLLLSNKHKSEGYDLCSGTHCQVYKGKHLQNQAILDAVRQTAGEVALYLDGVAETTYHSACGGKTESSANVWKGSPRDYLNGVECLPASAGFDLSSEKGIRAWIGTPLSFPDMSSWEKASLSWSKSISKAALARNLGLSYINRIVINKRGASGRILDISFYGSGSVNLNSEYRIRQAFGGVSSSAFYIVGGFGEANGRVTISPGATLNLKGRGSGHGVGMCQVGALRMARQGSSYREILEHYYPGVTISKLWIKDE